MTRAPADLEKAGLAFWREVTRKFTLRPDELRILDAACHEIDLVERMAEKLRDEELIVNGSMGQDVINPLVQQIGVHRGLVAKLLISLKLPDQEASTKTEGRSTSARAAAIAKWGKRGA